MSVDKELDQGRGSPLETPLPGRWETINRSIDTHYPRVLRLLGLVCAGVGVTMTIAGIEAGGTIVGLAGSLITAGIASEALKTKDKR